MLAMNAVIRRNESIGLLLAAGLAAHGALPEVQASGIPN
jgi:hypothetical protein